MNKASEEAKEQDLEYVTMNRKTEGFQEDDGHSTLLRCMAESQ